MSVFRNLTPHPIVVFRLDCSVPLVTLQPEPTPFRLPEVDLAVANVGLPIQHGPPAERSQQINYPDGWSEDGNYYLSVPVVSRRFEDPAASLPPESTSDPLLSFPVPVLWVVSLPALMALRAAGCTRKDVVAPDTGGGPYGAVRDDKGNIVGVRRFVYLAPSPEDEAADITFGTRDRDKEYPVAAWLKANLPEPPRYPLGNVKPL